MSLVECLHTLTMTRSSDITVDGFQMEKLDFIINLWVVNKVLLYNLVVVLSTIYINYTTCILNMYLVYQRCV